MEKKAKEEAEKEVERLKAICFVCGTYSPLSIKRRRGRKKGGGGKEGREGGKLLSFPSLPLHFLFLLLLPLPLLLFPPLFHFHLFFSDALSLGQRLPQGELGAHLNKHQEESKVSEGSSSSPSPPSSLLY